MLAQQPVATEVVLKGQAGGARTQERRPVAAAAAVAVNYLEWRYLLATWSMLVGRMMASD